MTKGPAEIARLFGARAGEGANFAAEVYPGYPGLVVAESEVRVMTWGFPLVLKGKSGKPLKPKPVNNAREDKLGTAFWRASFERRRCLIPVTAWAEAEGAKGAMTRTWYSLAGEVVFAVAGVWRPTEEWGEAYSMVMVDGCPQMADVHDRMPVVLARENWDQWLAGTPLMPSRCAGHAQVNLRLTAPLSAGPSAAADSRGGGFEPVFHWGDQPCFASIPGSARAPRRPKCSA